VTVSGNYPTESVFTFRKPSVGRSVFTPAEAHVEMVREVYVAIDKTRRLVRHEVGLATLEKNTAAASSGVLRTQLWSVGNKVEMAKPRKKKDM
jgi:hypothetical protein